MNKVIAYGLFIIFAGIIIILSALQIEEAYQSPSHFLVVALKLLDHIGIALISIGLIGIIVESRDWQKYFQERIADTIVQRAYLNRLDPTELLQLQANTLKAYFNVDDLDREESLLNFFHSKIQVFLASPYREDIDGIFTIDNSEDRKSFTLEETISFRCRKVGDSTIDQVYWNTRKDAVEAKLDEFKITVRIPRNFYQSPEFKTRYPALSAAQREKVFDMKHNDDGRLIPTSSEGELGYALSLSDYKGIDNLR